MAESRISDYVIKMQLLHRHLQALLSSSLSKFSPLGSTDHLSSSRPNWFFALAVFRRKDLLSVSPTSVLLKLLRMSLFELGPTTGHITILGRMRCDCAVWLKCPVLRENHHVNDRPPAVEKNFPTERRWADRRVANTPRAKSVWSVSSTTLSTTSHRMT